MYASGEEDAAGQIGYTSSRGGFGIHAEVGQLTDTERDLLVRGADPGRTDFGQPLPRFAAPDEVATFHRNLVVTPIPTGAAAWHSSPAGADESGRAGNVFIHALLDRAPAHDGRRLIDTWRSPDWTTPYGAAEVRGSALPPALPRPGNVVGYQGVCDFLLDPSTWRLGTLSVLLDELALPRGARGPVVLGVKSPDVGALWIGSVAHLMSPGAAAKLGFGVWESPRALQGDRPVTYEFICVASNDLTEIREQHPQLTILDDEDGATPRDWTSAAGGEAAWGALSVGMLSLADDPYNVLREIDEVSSRVGDVDLSRFWPLAMVMAQRLDSWAFLSQPIAAALGSGSPPSLAGQADLFSTTLAVVGRHTGESTADSWQALSACAPGPIAQVLQRIYLVRALADDSWLATPGGPPTRCDPGWRPTDHPGLEAEATVAVQRLAELDTPMAAVLMINLADLLIRSGWPVEDPDSLCDGQLLRGLAGCLRPVLGSAELRRQVTSMRHVSLQTRAGLLRPALADWPDDIARQFYLPLGRRTPSDVIAWLYPNGADDLGPAPEELSPLDLEALALVALAGPDRDARMMGRQLLLDALLVTRSGGETELPGQLELRGQLLAVIADSRPLRPAEVVRLIQADVRVSRVQLAAAILGAQEDERGEVVALLADSRVAEIPDGLGRSARWLQLILGGEAWGAQSFEQAVEVYAPQVVAAFKELWAASKTTAGPLWLRHLVCAGELVEARSDPHGFWNDVLPEAGGKAPGCGELFRSLISLRLTDSASYEKIDMLGMRVMSCEPDFPRPLDPQAPVRRLHSLVDGDSYPALQMGLLGYFSGLDRDSLAGCRDGVAATVARLFPDDTEVHEFARSWLMRISGSRGVGDRIRNVGGRLFGR